MPDYFCIFKNEKGTVEIQYERRGDALEIVDVHFQARPVTPFEQRQAERRKPRRGLELTDEEQHVEAMQPTLRREIF